jgi:hypothetical protein
VEHRARSRESGANGLARSHPDLRPYARLGLSGAEGSVGGLISHALRIASYKQIDRYAIEKGLPDQNIFCNAVTIIDPRFPDDDVRCITTIFDCAEAADYLTFKRKRWAKGKA